MGFRKGIIWGLGLVIMALFLLPACSSKTKCTSWVQADSLLEIKQCSDSVDREIECKANGKRYTCDCKEGGAVKSTFGDSQPMPEVVSRPGNRSSVLGKCNWQLSW